MRVVETVCRRCYHTEYITAISTGILSSIYCPQCGDSVDVVVGEKKRRYDCIYVKLELGNEPRILHPDTGRELERRRLAFRESSFLYKYVRIPRTDSLGMGPDREPGSWMEDAGKKVAIYMTCPACGRVNDISTNMISQDGVSQCFRCCHCQLVCRVVLDKWVEHRDPPIPFIVAVEHLH